MKEPKEQRTKNRGQRTMDKELKTKKLNANNNINQAADETK